MTHEENHKTVLLISDNQVDIRGIEKQFTDTGDMDCRLYRCTTIDAAVEQLGAKRLKIDIIILDLRLQDVGSPEDQYKTIENSTHGIPVIVLTGDSEEDMAQAAPFMAAGASGHIHGGQFGPLMDLIHHLIFWQ